MMQTNIAPTSLILTASRCHDTVNGRLTFGILFPIFKGSQLRIHCSDSEWYFSTKRTSVTRITTAQLAQIEIKWDLITKM